MLSADKFAAVCDAIRSAGRPSSGDNLLGMEMDFFAFLGGAMSESPRPAWRDLAVHRVEGGDWHIEATAKGDATASAEIAASLVEIWEHHLRYGYLEAHTIATSPDRVVLKAITQSGPRQLWVTARVVVTLE